MEKGPARGLFLLWIARRANLTERRDLRAARFANQRA
jgi:hypothetical protein